MERNVENVETRLKMLKWIEKNKLNTGNGKKNILFDVIEIKGETNRNDSFESHFFFSSNQLEPNEIKK